MHIIKKLFLIFFIGMPMYMQPFDTLASVVLSSLGGFLAATSTGLVATVPLPTASSSPFEFHEMHKTFVVSYAITFAVGFVLCKTSEDQELIAAGISATAAVPFMYILYARYNHNRKA